MLHSGSRNIGKEIAERHIDEAKGLEHNLGLPDRDLAVFLSGTPEMDAYLHDLYWAQEYAALNRAVMMALVPARWSPGVRRARPGGGVRRADLCHHNYVAEETYDGARADRDPQGRDPGGRGEYGHHPRFDGHRLVRRDAASATRRRTGPPRTAPAAGCRGPRPSAPSPSTTWPPRPRAWSAARTPAWSTRSPAPTRTSSAVIEAQTDLVEVVARLTTLMCVKG